MAYFKESMEIKVEGLILYIEDNIVDVFTYTGYLRKNLVFLGKYRINEDIANVAYPNGRSFSFMDYTLATIDNVEYNIDSDTKQRVLNIINNYAMEKYMRFQIAWALEHPETCQLEYEPSEAEKARGK